MKKSCEKWEHFLQLFYAANRRTMVINRLPFITMEPVPVLYYF